MCITDTKPLPHYMGNEIGESRIFFKLLHVRSLGIQSYVYLSMYMCLVYLNTYTRIHGFGFSDSG